MKKIICCYLLLACLIASCKKDNQSPLAADKVISINLAADQIQADNFHYAQINVQADPLIQRSSSQVVFSSTEGTFSGGESSYTTNLDLNGRATAYLKSSDPQTVTVTATINSAASNTITVHFVEPWPDNITLDVPVTSITNDPSVKTTLTARLLKMNGTLPQNYSVQFLATDHTGKVVGYFINNKPTDSNNQGTADYYLNSPGFTGAIYFKAYLLNAAKDTIAGRNQVAVTAQ